MSAWLIPVVACLVAAAAAPGEGAAPVAVAAAPSVQAVPAAAAGETARDFARRHWQAPIAPQGPAPAGFSPLEASLAPAACGACHPEQFHEWRQSLHAAAMGPGVAGQLVEMLRADPRAASGCYACHAPLHEQRPLARDVTGGPSTGRASAGPGAGLAPNPDHSPALEATGIPCAACHVRGHRRFGPPRPDGSRDDRSPAGGPAHGGATRTPAFLRSEFCESCHQFRPGGPALAGKLLQDTVNEWRASRFARAGVQCQDCHMPGRLHRWRGIHDHDMVRSGLSITARAGARRHRPGRPATVTLTLTSTRVGHAFPTYVTPRVIMRVELLDAAGAVIEGSRVEKVIAREVELDLSRELRDTRLRPGQRAVLTYRGVVPAPGTVARASVIVEPDAFYERFFETLLREGAGAGQAQIEEALAAARRSPFTVFVRLIPLT